MSQPRRTGRTLLIALAVAVGYYAGARLGFELRLPPAVTSVIWPPNASLTAVLLLTAPRRWWIYLAAAFPAHMLVELQAGLPLGMVLAFFVTNCSEAIMAAGFVHRYSDAPNRFDSLNRAVVFVVGAVFLATLLSTFLDAACVTILQGEPYGLVWKRRFLSNALSELTLVPSLVITVRNGFAHLRGIRPRRRLEAILLSLSLVAAAGVAFTGIGGLDHLFPGAPYTSLPLLMPFLVWAALRFGPAGTSLSLLATALLAIASALSGRRPFAMLSPEESVAALQVFTVVVGVPLLLLSGLLEERRRTAQALSDRLGFEQLLSRLSAAFVHPPSDQMSAAFDAWLKHLGESLGVDRISLRELSPDRRRLTLLHAWPGTVAHPLPREVRQEEFQWALERMLADEVVVLSRLEDVPAGMAATRELLRSQQLTASLTYPLAAGGRVLGTLSFACRQERSWPPTLVERWRLIADVLASALARKQTEDALRAGEAMKSDILASLASQVAVLDRTGHIVTVNQSWAQLMRETDMPIGADMGTVGTSFLEAWRGYESRGSAEAPTVLDGIQSVLGGSRPTFSLEYPCPAFRGQRWFAMTVVPLRATAEGGAVVSLSEVSERRQAEAEAARTRDELAHYLRVSTMGELTTSLAHQLNQPLAAILANAQTARRLLDARPLDARELREIVADIIEEDKRAGEVIADLRDLLRKGGAARGPVDINHLVGEVSRLLRSDVLIRGTTLRVEPHPEPLTVLGDRVQIRQVVLNLLVNAMEATADGGGDQAVLIRTERAASHYARISVQDTGPGLGDEARDRLFEPFYTSKASGMGMGLPIARSIVEAHGGAISAANNPDRGAIFTVVLPLLDDPAETGARQT